MLMYLAYYIQMCKMRQDNDWCTEQALKSIKERKKKGIKNRHERRSVIEN